MDPDTLADPRFKTDARFFYTEEGLYVGVYMQQPPETLIARLSVAIYSSTEMLWASLWIPQARGFTVINFQ